MAKSGKSKLKTFALFAGGALAILAIFALFFLWQYSQFLFQPTESSVPNASTNLNESEVRTVTSNIATPWAIAFLPDGDLLVTERSGQVQRIGDNGATYTIEGVRETSEGGLLGIALHPEFSDNKYIYLYSTTNETGTLTNRVERYQLQDETLRDRTIILADIPASSNHDGGALAFGPDDKLYVTTGDAGNEDLAQNTSSLAGKILRINDDGTIPSDNPFTNAVWSYGHRNPQGITWDDEQRLWSTEHGPSGVQSGKDELNLIEKGANYGWPVITGDETRDGMKTPVAQSGASDTWAPAGLAYANGSLYFAGLRGQALYEAEINDDNTVTLSKHFADKYGRLRAVAIRDSTLYFSTSNRDGRGSPAENDDRVFSVSLE